MPERVKGESADAIRGRSLNRNQPPTSSSYSMNAKPLHSFLSSRGTRTPFSVPCCLDGSATHLPLALDRDRPVTSSRKRTHRLKQLAQIMLLRRARQVGDVQLSVVGSSISPVLLAIRVRDEHRKAVPINIRSVKGQCSLRLSLRHGGHSFSSTRRVPSSSRGNSRAKRIGCNRISEWTCIVCWASECRKWCRAARTASRRPPCHTIRESL